MDEVWTVRIQLGAWQGFVTLPKDEFPLAREAHQLVLDSAWAGVDAVRGVS